MINNIDNIILNFPSNKQLLTFVAIAVADKVIESQEKIKQVIIQVFESIRDFFAKFMELLLPSKKQDNDISTNQEKNNDAFEDVEEDDEFNGKQITVFTDFVNDIHALSKNETKLNELNKGTGIDISKPATFAFLSIHKLIIPCLLATSGMKEQSLLVNFSTTKLLQQSCEQNFGKHLNHDLLKQVHMPLSKRDSIDSTISFAMWSATGEALSTFTFHQIDVPIQVALSILSSFAQVEDLLLENSVIKQVSTKLHDIVDVTRTAIKKPIKNKIKTLISTYLLQSGSKKIDQKMTHFAGNLVFNSCNSSEPLLPLGIGSLVSVISRDFVSEKINKPLVRVSANGLNLVADKLADVVVNMGTSMVTAPVKGYFFNKALQAAYQSNPFLAVTGIILGDVNPDVKNLSLRVVAATILILTGSAFWPMLIVQAPPTVNYLLRLRTVYLKQQGFDNDPAIEMIQQKMPFLANIMGWSSKEQEQLKGISNEESEKNKEIVISQIDFGMSYMGIDIEEQKDKMENQVIIEDISSNSEVVMETKKPEEEKKLEKKNLLNNDFTEESNTNNEIEEEEPSLLGSLFGYFTSGNNDMPEIHMEINE